MYAKRFAKIIFAYEHVVTRLYCVARFFIIGERFLSEIGQYLPRRGLVVDFGCGFGLFSLYYAGLHPDLQLLGVDLNPRRIERAKNAAKRLGIENANYYTGDVTATTFPEKIDAAYILDIIHHVAPSQVEPLLAKIRNSLLPEGILIIKDVEDRPWFKRWFTYILDKLMDYRTPVHYWNKHDLKTLLQKIGFRVYSHAMLDYLPYPHILYICYPLTSESSLEKRSPP